MAQTVVLFDRFMPARYLSENKNVQWNCKHTLTDGTHLSIDKDNVDYERIFRFPLVKKQTLPGNVKLEDLDISIEVGQENTSITSISWTIANDEHALGIQLLNTNQYTTKGPYIGIEGKPGRVLTNYGDNIGEGQDKVTGAYPTYWPDCFCMTFKPLEKLAACRSPIGSGHLFTTNYDEYNPTIDISQGDLFLDVYRGGDQEKYIINFVKVTVKMTTA